MEKKIAEIFSRVSRFYNSFCTLITTHDSYVMKLEEEILTRWKKEEDYPIKNHEEILRLVEEYPLEILKSLNEEEVDALSKKFSELIRASVLMYPTTPQFEEEATLVRKRITKPIYPLCKRFQRNFETYVRDLRYRRLNIESEQAVKVLIYIIYYDI